MYVNIAIDLSKQGNIVFVSCHKEVRDELSRFNNEEDIYVICPSLELEDEWIKKLKERYYFSNLEKDKKAYIAAENFYKDNIRDILTGKLKCIQITEMSYDLRNIILDLKINRDKY